jgi:hypothetical protein
VSTKKSRIRRLKQKDLHPMTRKKRKSMNSASFWKRKVLTKELKIYNVPMLGILQTEQVKTNLQLDLLKKFKISQCMD